MELPVFGGGHFGQATPRSSILSDLVGSIFSAQQQNSVRADFFTFSPCAVVRKA